MSAEVVTIMLDHPRTLFFRIEDLMDAETAMGHSVRQALADTSVSDLVTLLWAGLRGGGEAKVTRQQVARLLDKAKQGEGTTFGAWNTIAEALVAAGVLPRPSTEGIPDVDPSGPALVLGSGRES
jgi:hypothetical protein